ncbi:hypothetical protein OsI_21486 [Oryza sativa Indica Group]|uniref:Aminotransferase class I/classII large domain-containing protein n=1 Tax=Oryza sativa subsp. indica TaxID=39946 RepID=B8B2C1_ORYSI|nr:hypothetical protein OsI_21486 [Oryza sativa Indica Group]
MRRSGNGGAAKKKKKRSASAASERRPRADGGMRIVVPLQGGLYIKRNRASPPPAGRIPHGRLRRGGVADPPLALARLLAPRAALPAISARGASVRDDDSLYYAGLRRCAADPYHPVTNPSGIIQLGLAENYLSLDLVGRWMEEHAAEAASMAGGEDEDERELSIRGLAAYQPYDGILALKMALAGFMRQIMQGSVSFEPSQVVITSGATPAMEILSFCLADPGNAFLVPSPYYPGWDRDIKWRTGIELIPVPCRSTDNFNISITALEIAYNQAKKRGIKVRGVLISNPNNPTGSFVPKQTLHDLLEFAAEKNIHLISDEVFAGSTYGSGKFVSVAEVVDDLEDFDKGRVHIIYGLSKDLSLAGFRVGVIYSYNESIVTAAAKIARFSSVSTPTQRLLVAMLSDQKFISDYLKVNRERLRKMYHLFVDALDQVGIECYKSSGGFYCWADMSKFIRSYSEKGERKLWDRLLEEAKVNVTPGSSCHCIEPGWFRCCFTTLSEHDIPVLVQRLRTITDSHKPNH